MRKEAAHADKQARILAIIPAYNEETNITNIINEIRGVHPEINIVVIDDGSKDKTSELARKMNVTVISHPFNLRIGGAVQTGFKFAEREGYDVAIQVDADGQHNPSFISQIVKPLIEDKADISIGSRYLGNENVKISVVRHVGVKFFSWLTTKMIGRRITDCSSGFRALNRRAIKFFAREYPLDFPDAEALILAGRAGLRMYEVPVRFRLRNRGKSSLSFWRFLYYPIKEIFSIITLLTKERRRNI